MPPKSRQFGRGSGMSLAMADTLELLNARVHLFTKTRRKQWINKFIYKLGVLIQQVNRRPGLRECINQRPFNLYYLHPKIRPIFDDVLGAELSQHLRETTGNGMLLYDTIFQRFSNEAYKNAYIYKYSTPLRTNVDAFYFIRGVKFDLKFKVARCQYLLDHPPPPSSRTSSLIDTVDYRNRLPEKKKDVFKYALLKNQTDINTRCSAMNNDDEDERVCPITFEELTPGETFVVSHGDRDKYADCFHISFAFNPEGMAYKYYRHPTLRDEFMDIGHIRNLYKTYKEGTVGTGASAATQSQSILGGRKRLNKIGVSSSGGGQTISSFKKRAVHLKYTIRFKSMYFTLEKKKALIQEQLNQLSHLKDTVHETLHPYINRQFQALPDHFNRYLPSLYYILGDKNPTLGEAKWNALLTEHNAVGFFRTIIHTMENASFLNDYIHRFSKPLDLYAFDLLDELFDILDKYKWKAITIYDARNSNPNPHPNPHPDTHFYKNILSPSKHNAFQYQWLKTRADLKAHCEEEEDDNGKKVCYCDILFTELKPNHAFSVSYTTTNEKGETFTHTKCYDESVAFEGEAQYYAFYRHPIVKDKFIHLAAIRALKPASGSRPASGSSTGGKRERLGASKRV